MKQLALFLLLALSLSAAQVGRRIPDASVIEDPTTNSWFLIYNGTDDGTYKVHAPLFADWAEGLGLNAENLTSGTVPAARLAAPLQDLADGTLSESAIDAAITRDAELVAAVSQNATIVVDAALGSDSTGARGRPDRPFATVSAAVAVAQNNDLVRIRPGVYTETPSVSGASPYGAAIRIQSKSGITIVGEGMPEIALAAHGPGILLENSANITLRGFRIRGQGKILSGGGGSGVYFALVMLEGATIGTTIEGCEFLDSGAHGVGALYPSGSTVAKTRIINNYFEDGGNFDAGGLLCDGAAIALGRPQTVIKGNVIKDWFRGIEIECSSALILTRDVLVAHNQVLECHGEHITVMPNHHDGTKFKNISIIGNQVRGLETVSTLLGGNAFSSGINITGGEDINVSGNNVQWIPAGVGISFNAGHAAILNATISGNTIYRCGWRGLQFVGSVTYTADRANITGNSIYWITDRGILVERGTRVHVAANNVQYSGVAAIYLHYADYATVTGNRLHSHNNAAIRVTANTTGAILRGNYDNGSTSRIEDLGVSTDRVGAFVNEENWSIKSTLQNGINTGVTFTTDLVKITAGPTQAYTIYGVAGGYHGRRVRLWNNTGQNLILAHENATEPTPANRIISMTGTGVTSTGDCFFELVYDGAASRWVIVSQNL